MPGLFGVLRMSGHSASPSDLRATFERMARVLGKAETG